MNKKGGDLEKIGTEGLQTIIAYDYERYKDIGFIVGCGFIY